MSISSSLYSSISGLNTMGNSMSVLGDNVANVNTVAFKSSRATFQDVLSQSVSTAAGSAQIGRGVTLTTVDGLFAQGSFESTSTATDLAIGGQGFFMLRAADSSEADRYSRAGEFRFDQEGYLVNPVGHFVQGWTIDAKSGEVQGTIGDINLGKSTPPVSTESIEIITNLDSREVNETNEQRLFDAWNGTNAAAVNPTAPIDSGSYEYTSSIKVYDAKGASHDVTVYFDRTTTDNEWEFLVTCEPSEDLRYMSAKEQTIYAPNETVNYEEHKGAGALMYGVINFTTAGDISKISAWKVPPDAKVDISLDDNRLFLEPTDSYYSFEANFTGATTNQEIALNFGARYGGLPTNLSQVLVSAGGAFDSVSLVDSITKETLLGGVYDSGGQKLNTGDVITWSGYDNEGLPVSGSYVVDAANKVSNFLLALGSDFDATASIDAEGRLRLTDNNSGPSGMFVTGFNVVSFEDAAPFGGTNFITQNGWVTGDATTMYLSDGTNPVTDSTTALVGLEDGSAVAVGAADTWTFGGVDADGVAIPGGTTFTAGANTIDDLLTFLETTYGGASGAVTATLGMDGRIRIVDLTLGGNLQVEIDSTGLAEVLGADTGGLWALTDAMYSTYTQVDIASSKTTVVSQLQAFNTDTGQPPFVTATTTWGSVYAADTTGPVSATAPIDGWTFTGTRGDGAAVSDTFYVSSDTATVQELLTWLEDKFNADAYIDNAGRLNLRDWDANTSSWSSQLAISGIVNQNGAPDLFGTTAFSTIAGSLTEDGSRVGDVVSTTFETEALASTQYANASTTIFQDQNGFAAGFLQSVSVDTDGIITGHYSNGQVLEKAQVALASFNNLAGLYKEGGNIFRESTDSGAPITGAPGTNGLGSIAPNALEQSNVDLGNEFVKLITTQRGFQANSKVITTTDEMLADLINIKR